MRASIKKDGNTARDIGVPLPLEGELRDSYSGIEHLARHVLSGCTAPMHRLRNLSEYGANDQTAEITILTPAPSRHSLPHATLLREGINHDGGLSTARGRIPVGHLPPLSPSPSILPGAAAAVVTTEWVAAGKSLSPHRNPAQESTADGHVVTMSPKRPGPTRTGAEDTASAAPPKKPVSLLKQKIESSIAVGGELGGGAGGPARVSVMHKPMGREPMVNAPRSMAHGGYDAATAPPLSMRAAGGESREEAAQRRPQRYDKIKMKTSPTSRSKKNVNITEAIGLNREGAAAHGAQAGVGIRPIAFKIKTAGAAFGALTVARRVASGFRGDPDWASRASRSAGRRQGTKWHAFLTADRQHDSQRNRSINSKSHARPLANR